MIYRITCSLCYGLKISNHLPTELTSSTLQFNIILYLCSIRSQDALFCMIQRLGQISSKKQTKVETSFFMLLLWRKKRWKMNSYANFGVLSCVQVNWPKKQSPFSMMNDQELDSYCVCVKIQSCLLVIDQSKLIRIKNHARR